MADSRRTPSQRIEDLSLSWDPFDGADRDVDIRCRSVKIVTTKAPRLCYGADGVASQHDMPTGTRARVERALVDGEWGSYYICLACMETWLRERELLEADQ
jgi:hypothetical protein